MTLPLTLTAVNTLVTIVKICPKGATNCTQVLLISVCRAGGMLLLLSLTGLPGVGHAQEVHPQEAHPAYYSLDTPEQALTHQEALYQAIGLDVARHHGFTGRGVAIGVIDSGVNLKHREMIGGGHQFVVVKGRMRGAVVTLNGSDNLYAHGHGTMVAGVIAAAGVGGTWSFRGVAPGATVVAGQIFPLSSDSSELWKINGASARAVVDTPGVRVINVSWDVSDNFPDLATLDAVAPRLLRVTKETIDALQAAAAKGQLIVVASGNEENTVAAPLASLPRFIPAMEHAMLTVTGVEQDQQTGAWDRTTFTLEPPDHIVGGYTHCAENMQWCLAAPARVLTTSGNGNYIDTRGTSYSTPLVSAAAALLMEKFPYMSATQIREVILTTAIDLGEPGVDAVYGHGLLAIDRALKGPGRLRQDFMATVGAGSATVWSNDISGSARLYKLGAGAMELSGQNQFGGLVQHDGTVLISGITSLSGNSAVLGGSLTVDGALAAALLDVGEQGQLRGTGYIEAPTRIAGNLRPGNSPGTLYFGAPLELTSTSRTTLEIDGAGTNNGAGNYSRIIVVGSSNTLQMAGTLLPQLRELAGSATNIFIPAKGDSFTVMAAQGGLSGGFARLVQPVGMASGTRFDLLFDKDRDSSAGPGDKVITARLHVANDVLPEQLQQQGNARAGADALNALRDRALFLKPGAWNDWLAGMSGKSASANTLFARFGGQIHADVLSRAAQQASAPNDIVKARLNTVVSSAQPTAWAQVVGGVLHETAHAGGVDVRTTHAAAWTGTDVSLREGQLGMALGLAEARIQQDAADATISSTVLVVYGRQFLPVQGDAMYVDAMASLAYSDYQSHRSLASPGVDDFSGKTHGWGGRLETALGWQIAAGQWRLNPEIALRYDYLTRRGFQENGDDAALSVAASALYRSALVGKFNLEKSQQWQHWRTALGASVEVEQALWRKTAQSQSQIQDISMIQNAARDAATRLSLAFWIRPETKSHRGQLLLRPIFASGTVGLSGELSYGWTW